MARWQVLLNQPFDHGPIAAVNRLVLQTHPNPKKALSDGNTMLKLNQLKKMLKKFVAIKKAIS